MQSNTALLPTLVAAYTVYSGETNHQNMYLRVIHFSWVGACPENAQPVVDGCRAPKVPVV